MGRINDETLLYFCLVLLLGVLRTSGKGDRGGPGAERAETMTGILILMTKRLSRPVNDG